MGMICVHTGVDSGRQVLFLRAHKRVQWESQTAHVPIRSIPSPHQPLLLSQQVFIFTVFISDIKLWNPLERGALEINIVEAIIMQTEWGRGCN